MRKRRTDETQPMTPMPRDDRRLKLRREILRNLQVTELKIVMGGIGCQVTVKPPP